MENCKLCRINVADKLNSHVIPKFMCKGLFEDSKPRHSIEINRKGKAKKIQDTPKENNIFCTSCEKRIEIIETYFARQIIEINNYINLKDKIEVINITDQQYLICKNINPTIFKLFIYSLVWRCSISKLNEYDKYSVASNIEEELRDFLNENLKITHKELFENIKHVMQYPSYDFCLIKPFFKTQESRGIFTAFNSGENSHLLMLVDFAVYFFTDENSMNATFKFYSNKQNEKVIIAMGEIEKWKDLNLQILNKMLN